MAEAILSATALQRINLLTEQAWTQNQRQIDQWALDTVTFDTLLSKQNSIKKPLVDVITDPNKDYDVRVWWNDFCGQEAEDCASGLEYDASCGDLSGSASQVDHKDYAITGCIQKKFIVNEATFKGSWMDINKNVEDNQNQAIRQILNALNKKAIVFLAANAGLNKGNQFSPNGSDQYVIPAATMESTRVYTDIMYDALKSRLQNPFIIDFGNLWHLNTNALFDGANADGKGDAARVLRQFNITSDIQGSSQVPAAAGSTFVVTPYSYAFVNKSFYQRRTQIPGEEVRFEGKVPVYDPASDKWKYYIEVPGYNIVIDVLKQRVCVDARKDIYEHRFQYTLNYDFLLNPVGCDNGAGGAVTGIIEYLKEGSESSASS